MTSYEALLPAMQAGSNLHHHHQAAWRIFACGRDGLKGRDFIFSLRDIGHQEYLHLRATEPFPGSVERPTQVEPGQQMTIRVKLHPIKTIKEKTLNGGAEVKRIGLVPPDQRNQWATEMLQRRGMAVTGISLLSERVWPWGKRGYDDISTLVSEFQAEITVVDTELFQQAWVKGIGKRKGYGLGMMVEVKA